MADENESESEPSEEELEEAYSDESKYTVKLNDKEYELNEEWRESIERLAEGTYRDNWMFSCWWRVATEEDEKDPDSVHEEGDPILVIETEGPMVPWERLDQLEVEMKDVSGSYDGIEPGGSDVDEGGGMKTIRPGEVDPSEKNDDSEEMDRLHFGITPQDFEEVPGPDGERADRIPPKPMEFDEPSLVFWLPDDPDVTHRWSAGEAITPMFSWVEWNVQQRANQPNKFNGTADMHGHYESIAQMHDAEVVAKLSPKQKPPKESDKPKGDSAAVKRQGKDAFENGRFGGDNWSI